MTYHDLFYHEFEPVDKKPINVAAVIIVLITMFVFVKVNYHAFIYPHKSPDFKRAVAIGMPQIYTAESTFMGAKDLNFSYPPVWFKYIEAVKTNEAHQVINALLTLITIVIIAAIFKLKTIQTCILTIIMCAGMWGSYFLNTAQGNMSAIEMFFLWCGIALFLKRHPLAALFFLAAGSIKFYYWIFCLLFLFNKDIKSLVFFAVGLVLYGLLNYAICRECVLAGMNNLTSYVDVSYPFGILPAPLKVVWVLGLITALVCLGTMFKNTPGAVLLFYAVVISFSPRLPIYQYFIFAPVVFYVACYVFKSKSLLVYLVAFTMTPWGYNYYIITVVMFILTLIMFGHVFDKCERGCLK